MYYGPQREDGPAGCRQVWTLTIATFAVVLPVVGALIGVLGAVALALVLFSVHPALALIPIAALVAAVVAFAQWEQRRHRLE